MATYRLPEGLPDQNICIVGLGYVGLTLAVVMADVGFNVLGVEIRDEVLEKLKLGEPHFHEPGLKDKLARVIESKHFSVLKKIPEGCRSTVFIVTVGTPLGSDGKPRFDMIENCAREVARHLKDGDLVILRSTVMLGVTRKLVLPILEATGKSFELAFCPERTLEGKALSELRELPQIVGGYSFKTAIRAAQIFQMLTSTVVRVRDLETAEMIKLVDNTQRDVAFAFSNEIARTCDLYNISALQVIQAGKLGYPRTNLPLPGPVGGPCLAKDSYILAEALKPFGIEPEIALTARRLNERLPFETVAGIKSRISSWKGLPKKMKITMMGLAFKGRPETDDLRGTMAKPIFEALKQNFPDANFYGFDPVVSKSDIKEFGLEPCPNLIEAFNGSHLVLILNNHLRFSSMPIETLVKDMASPSLVYDYWNTFIAEDLHFPNHVGYMALGSAGKAILPQGVA
jgi:nucleotide sugar dehydrogenase